ncbi:MAG TPA: acireductone synthase [Vicinamibacterales bacterium]|jgi:enolase-phosphatase E1|nr:acireductone synthase [Vicinamibacterales bacterium]
MRVHRGAIDAILLDIEGTTTPIAFVHDVLFPFARRHMREFLKDTRGTAPVADALMKLELEWADDAAKGQAPPPWTGSGAQADVSVIAAYLEWLMDRDRKSPALKLIQGLIWQRGYRARELTSDVYPDVRPAIERWKSHALVVAIYSSGSALAQRLLFAHTGEGDMTPLLGGFFDTDVGPKTAAHSYEQIAGALGTSAGRLLFVSDAAKEVEAAHSAGCQTVLCVRPGNPIQAPAIHIDAIRTFDEIAVV